MAQNDNDGKRVIIKKGRLSFPYLFTPRPPMAGQTGDPKFSVMVLIDKKDKATIAALRAAEKKALEDGLATKFGGRKTGLAPSIIKDADEDGTAEDYPERAGHLYMTVNATQAFKPQVVDKDVEPVMDQSEVYSGVYANVSVSAFAYKNDLKKGISFGLNNVQVLGYGETLAGGKRASEEFEVEEISEEDAALL